MNCQTCGSPVILEINAKCSDLCWAQISHLNVEHDGYVPGSLGIGGGDYVEFDMCLDCGQVQGTFPQPPAVDEFDPPRSFVW